MQVDENAFHKRRKNLGKGGGHDGNNNSGRVDAQLGKEKIRLSSAGRIRPSSCTRSVAVQ